MGMETETTTTGTTSSQLSAEDAAINQMIKDEALRLYETGGPQYFQGNLVAGLSPEQFAAMGGIVDFVGGPATIDPRESINRVDSGTGLTFDALNNMAGELLQGGMSLPEIADLASRKGVSLQSMLQMYPEHSGIIGPAYERPASAPLQSGQDPRFATDIYDPRTGRSFDTINAEVERLAASGKSAMEIGQIAKEYGITPATLRQMYPEYGAELSAIYGPQNPQGHGGVAVPVPGASGLAYDSTPYADPTVQPEFNPETLRGQTGQMGAGIWDAMNRSNTRDIAYDSVQNPYLQDMVDAALSANTRQFETQVMPGLRSGYLGAGQYGSSRQGIAEGLATEALARENATTSSGMFGTAFENIRKGNLDAQVANQSADLSAGQLGLSAAQTIPQVTDQTLRGYGLLSDIGGVKKEQEQKTIDEARAKWDYEQNQDYDSLLRYAQMVNPTMFPQTTSTQTEVTEPGDGAAIAAGISTGLGIYDAFNS